MSFTICHQGDVHIHNLQRHEEYREIFQQIYQKLEEQQPDKIVIVGDLFEKFVQITNEAKDLAAEYLHRLTSIAKVIIVPGNHDLLKKNKKRLNSVLVLVRIMKNPNITYYGHSGFFEDDDLPIVWVNYSHLEKDIIPWVDIKHTRKKDKIYIALHHDPINGSSNENGLIFRSTSYLSPEDFDKNNYTMLSDIHKRQYFRDKRIAYPSSLIQQNFGEHPSDLHHGYLLWKIDDSESFDIEEISLENPYNYVNLKVTEGYNYEMIDLDNPYITPQSQIKVKWHDYSAQINFENEMKIRHYIKDKWGIDKVKFERENIYTDVSGVDMVNENINVLDPKDQREIFIEFLKTNKHPKEFIDAVMKIDEIINNRLDNQNNNGVSWSIDKFWFNNFKSFGDGNLVEWEGNNGIWQLHGQNQVGKSTILDAVSWILYGRTPYTLKRERHGDSRFFNNKREKDTVNGGAIITINGHKYTITREYNRKWTKSGNKIASIISNVDYFEGDDVLDENKMTDEQRKDTQKLIESTIGDFDDFLRLVLTTADNLNDMLSMDRATFMDSLIKDAGFDIFDNKLQEFKEFRKEIQDKRKNIDIEFVEIEIERITDEKKDNESILNRIDSVIDELNETKKLQVTIKEEKIKQLDKIDDELKTLDILEIEGKIEEENEKIKINNEMLDGIDVQKKIVEKYNPIILSDKEEKYTKLLETVNASKLGQSEYENKISNHNNEIRLIGIDIENIVKNYINELSSTNKDLDMEIMKLKEEFVEKVNEYLAESNTQISNLVDEQGKIHTDIERLMEEGKHLKTENHGLENSKVCIMCERELEEKDIIVIQEKLSTNKTKMAEIMEKVNELKPLHKKLGDSISELRDKLIKIKDKDYSFDTELLNVYNKAKERIKLKKDTIEENNTTIEFIKNNNTPNDLKQMIEPYHRKKSDLSLLIDDLNEEYTNIKKDLLIKQEELEVLLTDISKLKEEKEIIEKKKVIISNEIKISMDVERCKSKIKILEDLIVKYNEMLDKIENNKKIEKEIEEVDSIILELDETILENTNDKMNHNSTVRLFESQLKQYTEDIQTYNAHKKQDEIMNTYMKCVHRDGLPTFLLKKSVHIINQELTKILTDVDFTVYFDSELNLKLSADNRLDIAQNAIESSGMERTFTAVALKIALRKVNNKSKPNFILLDEIMGKLIDESVETFIKLLDNIKEDVDKLVIIEHVHPINYDVLIEVEKDIDGISTLDIIEG